jgi:hypothetical protein
LNHFSEVDYSSAQSDFGGVNNAPNYPNRSAFAAFKDDRAISIMAWGNLTSGGKKVPTAIDLGYTKLYSNSADWVRFCLQNMGTPMS